MLYICARGYYRCSSSKGCSARKQVERSRTDPNMLVITYTSEHNHPWPTQRNALAGSTRSQPSKNNPTSTRNTPLSSQLQMSTTGSTTTTISSPKEEVDHQQKNKDIMMISKNDNYNAVVGPARSTTSASVKEENVDQHDHNDEIEKLDQLEDSESCHDHHQFSTDEVVGLYPYRPAMPEGPNPGSVDQDFFADLAEIEADPLNLLFSQGYPSVDHHHDHQHKGMIINKGLDHFNNLFDWSGCGGDDNNTNNNNK